MPRLSFAFLREGTSDDGLLPHLRSIVIRAGATEVIGASREYSGTLENRLRTLMTESSAVSLVFVHRDADSQDPLPRIQEVARAATNAGTPPWVAVVPVQELEAWLLTDEQAIRAAVGRPSGREDLSLPRIAQIERTSAPKEILRSALLTASATTGRKRQDEQRRFALRRRTLLERLDIDGAIRQLPSWRQLESDVGSVVAQLLQL
jgi:Domain of unknown function (DUF4276)